jgi:hypothetical protein
MEHIQLVQWGLSAVVVAAVAWGGSKYAIADHGKKLAHHQALIEGMRSDMANLTPLSTTTKINDELKKMVPFSVCREKQAECRDDNESSTSEILRKIDKLFEAMALQDEKREAGKDKFHEAITTMAKQVAALEATIRERGKMFRKEGENEPHCWI